MGTRSVCLVRRQVCGSLSISSKCGELLLTPLPSLLSGSEWLSLRLSLKFGGGGLSSACLCDFPVRLQSDEAAMGTVSTVGVGGDLKAHNRALGELPEVSCFI